MHFPKKEEAINDNLEDYGETMRVQFPFQRVYHLAEPHLFSHAISAYIYIYQLIDQKWQCFGFRIILVYYSDYVLELGWKCHGYRTMLQNGYSYGIIVEFWNGYVLTWMYVYNL